MDVDLRVSGLVGVDGACRTGTVYTYNAQVCIASWKATVYALALEA
jgi:hypothetical protein